MSYSPTVIAASLSDAQLKQSISDLVNSVDTGMDNVAAMFDQKIQTIEQRFSTFGTNITTSLQNAFNQIGLNFQQMVQAMQQAANAAANATGSNGGSGSGSGSSSSNNYAPDTIGALKAEIAELKKLIDLEKTNSAELQRKVDLLREAQNLLKEQTTSPTSKLVSSVIKSQATSLQDANRKLAALEYLQKQYAGTTKLSVQEQDRLTRAISQTQQQIERLKAKAPKSLEEVMGMDESSVDAIAKKMRALRLVQVNPNDVSQVKQLGNEYQRLSRLQAELLGKNIQLTHSNNYLAQSFGYIRNRIMYALTLGAITNFTKQLYEVRAQYELLERSLGVLVGSFEQGTQIFRELNEMALKSPFTLIELSTAAKQLSAYNFEAKEVVDTTRRLADISAALGVPMERLTYNLGQIRAQTVLTARDARDFANAGLPIVKTLADYYTELEGRIVSTGDVYDRMSKKMVSYNDVMMVLTQLTDKGGKFFDFQAKQAETLRVQIANLNLAYNNMLNEMGSANQSIISAPIKGLRLLYENWREVSDIITNVISVWGVYKATSLVINNVIGTTTKAINASIIADKEKIAVELRRKALTQELSGEELVLLSTRKAITAQDYMSILAGKNLTKMQGLLLVATSRNNIELQKALIRMGILTAAEIRNLNASKLLTLVWGRMKVSLQGLGKAMMAIAFNPMTWAMAAISAAISIVQHFNEVSEAAREMNRELSENAKEAADSMQKYLSQDAIQNTKTLASQEKLNKATGQKAWESLKEQIELSSDNADVFISKLLDINDINQRISQGFDIAEKIETATNKLSDLDEKAFNVSQDSWLNGAFGEGLAEDIEDYIEHIEKLKKEAVDIWGEGSKAENYVLKWFDKGADSQEARKEMQYLADDLAETLTDRLEGDINNSEVLSESIERFRRIIKSKNPQIRGDVAKWFDVKLDELLNQKFGDAFNKTTSLNRQFLTTLKLYYNSAFKSITSDIYKEGAKWKEPQEEAIRAAAAELKKTTVPEFHSAIDDMVRYMNRQDWRIRIAYELGIEQLSDFQEEWERRLGKKRADQQKAYRPNKNETLPSWAERMRQQLKALREEEAAYSKDDSRYSKERLATVRGQIYEIETLLNLFKQPIDPKSAAKAQKQAESELQKALKSELQLIEKVSSAYNELTKSGTTHFDAIKKSTEGFDESVANINKVLNKYDLNFDLSKFAGTQNPREIVNMLQHQINTLLTKAKPAEIQDLQVEVQKLNLKVETFDQKTLADSLNNKLSKLKDEYELAVELDANPELGDLFTNMFDIDTSSFPHTISEYMQRVQDAFNNEIDKRGWNLSINVFKANAEVWKQWGDAIGLSKEALDQFKAKFVEAQVVAEKWAKDVITQTKQLEYELGDVSKKIEIEQGKLSKLYSDYFTALLNDNVQSARLLELQIEKQQQTIDKLRAGLLEEIPEYAKVFNSITEHSNYMTRRLINDLRKIYDEAKKHPNADGTYTITGSDGKTAILSRKEFDKAYAKLDKEARKAQAPFAKIKDAFTKDKDGVIDYAKGIELVSTEVQKLGNVASEIGNLAQILGANEETVEIINDVAASLNGVATVGQGISQIASGDYLGGIASVLSGVTTAISSWFDNGDKKILSMIKDSELAVKKLEVSYKNLQNAEEDAFGTAVMGAQQAMKANRELQLVELKRQLALEQRREGKHRDEERIASLRGEIIDLEHEIAKATLETFNNLADISSFGDLFQSMIDEMIDAFKQGEDAMKVFSEKWDAMIDSLVGKMIYQQIVSVLTKDLEKVTQGVIEKYTKNISKSIAETQEHIDYLRSIDPGDISEWIYKNDNAWFNQILQNLGFSESFNATANKRMWFNDAWNKGWLHQIADAYLQMLQNSLNVLNDESEKASLEATKELIPTLTEWGKTIQEGGYLQDILDRIQDIVTPSNDAQLSALQQGIQGITEDTAGALEAYMNGVSQQVYLHSDLLTQIRDAVIGFNMDASLGVQSQMLFELQQSYAVQMAIQNILTGWSSANGLAVKVEMV